MKKLFFFKKMMSLLAMVLLTTVASGQTTYYWDFTTNDPSGSDVHLSVGAVSIGNTNGTVTMLSSTSAGSGYAGASGGNNAGNAARTGVLNTETSGSAYFQFTVTPVAGYAVGLNFISFGTRSTGTGPISYTLRSSVDNYTLDIATGTISTGTWALKTNSDMSFATSSNDAVTFRLYGHSGSGSASSNIINWRIDDLTLELSAISLVTTIYAETDKAALRTFLLQTSADGTNPNYTKVGLTATDVATWETDEDWVPKVTGIYWDNSAPKRLMAINWWNSGTGYALAGSLDATPFTNLTELDCENNSLTSLNMSGLTNLVKLYCENNSLTSLNVSGCTGLDVLFCYENLLTSLNVLGLTNLTELDCENNSLTSLDVSGLTNLTELNCSYNSLTSLDVSGLTNLTWLNCSYNSLTSLDVSGLTNLQTLSCGNNSLMSLDVSGLTNLMYLYCYYNSLTSLNVSGLTNLQSLYCSYNSLTSLNVSELTNLQLLHCGNNSLTSLDVSGLTNLTRLYCYYNSLKFSTLPSVISQYTHYLYTSQKAIEGGVSTGMVDLSSEYLGATTTYTWYEVNGANETPLSGTDYTDNGNGTFTFQSTLDGKTLRCKMTNTSFPDFTVEGNELVYNVTMNILATQIYAEADKAALRTFLLQTSADGTNPNYTKVGLTATDVATWETDEDWVSKVAGLTWDDSAPKRLTKIDWCNSGTGYALAGNLDATPFINLMELDCDNNSLTSLNVSGLTNLQTLSCYNNSLTSLNVSGCTGLDVLYCSENSLTSLDVSGLTGLTELYCDNNFLTSLDVSGLTNLTELNCSYNSLTSLNVSGLTNLIDFHCDNNSLKFSTLPSVISQYTHYLYTPQKAIEGGVSTGTVDLSSEYLGATTTYTWYEVNGANETPLSGTDYTDNGNGTFTFQSTLDGKTLRCKMTNTSFPDFTVEGNELVYNVTMNILATQIYAEADKAALRTFLLQTSADGTNPNYTKVGLTATDVATWETDEDWVPKVADLTWDDSAPKRLTRIDWYNNGNGYSLAGSLDATACANLTYLDCDDNSLTSLNVSGLTNLMYLSCYGNLLTSLDVSGLTNLQTLYCYNNSLTSLDVSGLTNLQTLYCYNNSLTSLDVLDVSELTNLMYLYCSDNSLTSLDVSELTNLQTLSCYNNSLTSLNVSGCTGLDVLYCSYNSLTSLNVSGLTNLIDFHCDNNSLKFSTLPSVISQYTHYLYTPQKAIEGGVSTGTVDLSSEYLGATTTYTWYEVNGANETPLAGTDYTDNGNGTFTFQSTLDGKTLRCKMTNTSFPDFTVEGNELVYNVTMNILATQIYAEADKTALRTFLLQTSADGTNPNYTKVGLTATDVATWETDEDWVSKVAGLTWDDSAPKRLMAIDWWGNTLAGSLDATPLTNLMELYCNNNSLTSLDVSGCTGLDVLYCSYNSLTSLDVSGLTNLSVLYCYNNSLTSLDVAGLTNLTRLYCSNNSLTSLDVLDVSELTNLMYLYCSDNSLTSLDVSELTNLSALYCYNNSLTSLDVSGLTNLQTLYCYNNSLTSLDVSELTNLMYLYCSDNSLTSLDVSELTNLSALYCYNNSLTSLDVSGLNNLSVLYCYYNFLKFSTLPSVISQYISYSYIPQKAIEGGVSTGTVDLSSEYLGATTTYTWYEVNGANETPLSGTDYTDNGNGTFTFQSTLDGKTLRCKMTNTSFPDFTVEGNELVYNITMNILATQIYAEADKAALRTFLLQTSADGTNPNYTKVGLTATDVATWETDEDWVSKVAGLTWDDSAPKRLMAIDWCNSGTGYALAGNLDATPFTNLMELYCDNNFLTSLDVSGLTNLTELHCYNNSLTSLDVEGLTNLSVLYCHNNSLTFLDVSGATSLSFLYCDNNSLTFLDVEGLTNLSVLYCYNNSLTSLNVSGLTNLQTLSCYNNSLTSLNVSELTNLTESYCYNNFLTSLDVAGATNLSYLYCNNNSLTSLDLSGATNLSSLYCENNSLTSLNVSGLTNLQTLSCYENLLTSLNVSGLINLTNFYCDNNSLTSLDVSELTNLSALYCSNNSLTSLNVSGLTNLTRLYCYYNSLKFSTLPSVISQYTHYLYTPQKAIEGGVSTGMVDLSSEYLGATTTYTWYEVNGANETPLSGTDYTDNGNGTFTFQSTFDGKTLRCKMTNTSFPDFTVEGNELVYNVTMNILATQIYAEADKAALRTFLLQTSADGTNPNYTKVGLTATDVATWEIDENWVSKVAGLTWDDSAPKRLTKIDWCNSGTGYALAGNLDATPFINLMELDCDNNSLTSLNVSGLTNLQTLSCYNNSLTSLNVSGCTGLDVLYCSENSLTSLDVSGLTGLTELYCDNNFLTSLDVSGLTNLTELNCSYNSLTSLNVSGLTNLIDFHCDNNSLKFSTLPSVISQYTHYLYTPQKAIEGGVSTGTVDLSSEYLGATTTYTWYEVNGANETPLSGTDYTDNGNGTFTFQSTFDGKTLRCKMTNTSFPDFTVDNELVYNVTMNIPVLTVSPENLTFPETTAGQTAAAQTVTISGIDLIEGITYEKIGTDAAVFTIVETSWNVVTGGTLNVTFTPSEARAFNASIVISSDGAENKTVTLNGTGIAAPDVYTIVATAETGGNINPEGEIIVSNGGTKMFSITPSTGYAILDVLVDGNSVGAVTRYTFNKIKDDHTIVAKFTKHIYTITSTVTGTIGGEITPTGSVSVEWGDEQTYVITPEAGFQIAQVLVDGKNNAAAVVASTHTFTNVTANHTISVKFERLKATITATAETGGSISPRGNVIVNYGAEKTFTVTPATGYKTSEVLIDDVNNDEAVVTGRYTFENIDADHSIVATFERIQYAIVATADLGGSISPVDTTMVNYGSSQKYVIMPEAGFKITQVLIDGVNNTAAVRNGYYTFSNVKAPHTIVATFASDKGMMDIEEENVVVKTTVYPNPTTGELKITNEKLRMNTIRVFDITGKLVLERKNVDAEQTSIDLSDRAPGMYFLHIDGKVVKVVKQ